MSKIRLAIVGCGGMGHRHLFGLAELQRAGLSEFELVGACDPVAANAQSLAAEAESLLGGRPVVVGHIDELGHLDIQAVDITTTPRYHHPLAITALQQGWAALIEKPMGLTVRACNQILQAAAGGGILSVAENYRRDPINRLAKALLDGGVIGQPRFLIHHTIGGGDLMLISVWRHQKDQSGVLLDVGVHYADMMEYLLGEVESVYARTRLHEPTRKNPAFLESGALTNPGGVYSRWQKEMPPEFEATAEDAVYATLNFKNGAVGQYIEEHAAHGENHWIRQIYGSRGSLDLPNDRSGRPLTLHLSGQEPIGDGQILELASEFRLDPVTAALFGGERLWRYDFPFVEVDRKLIAVEYAELAIAIRTGQPPEVDAAQGTRSVAVSYAMLEAGLVDRPVTLDEVLAGDLDDYQQEINQSLQI